METLATSRILTASKKRFKSARAAWVSIGKRTGLEPSDVRSAGNTRTKWRWRTSISNRKRTNKVAKRARSAKQKANDKRLGAMAKARGRKSAPKRRKTRKANKPRKASRRTVAKRRTTRHKKGILGKIPLINNSMFQKAARGVGTATLGAAALALVLPQFASNPIVKPVLALAGGGAIGAVAQVLTQGGLSGLGLGGGSSTASVGGNGFA